MIKRKPTLNLQVFIYISIFLNKLDTPAEEPKETQEPVIVHKVRVYSEVTGWKVILDMLQNPKTITQALFNLGSLAEAKGSFKI